MVGMDPSIANHRDRVAGALADDQHGQASRAQLRARGVSAEAIKNSLAAHRLRPMFPGVYAVGHRAVTTEGWCQAALLYCGDDAVLGHHTASLLWRMATPSLFPICLIVPSARGRELSRLRPRRMRLHHRDWQTLDGLRLTTPARTIVDMAGELTARGTRRLIERAQDVKRFDPRRIEAVLERSPRRPGCRPLLDLLALLRPDGDGARSHLERLFLRLLRSHGLPLPEVNVTIEGRERDFVWREQRLVVEVDGYAFHSSKAAIARDKRRDRELTAALWRPARFTYEEVAFEPTATATELAGLLTTT